LRRDASKVLVTEVGGTPRDGGHPHEDVSQCLAEALDSVVDGPPGAADLGGNVPVGNALQAQGEHLGLEGAEGVLGEFGDLPARLAVGRDVEGVGRGGAWDLCGEVGLAAAGSGPVPEEGQGLVEGLVLAAAGCAGW
jgi:hypothetical protein